MYNLRNFNYKTLKNDLINKFIYKKTNEIPRLDKIVLNFGYKTSDLRNLATGILAFELCVGSKGHMTTAAKPNLSLKIRIGNPVGCKIVLRKKTMLSFILRYIFDIHLKRKELKEFLLTSKLLDNSFSFEIENNFVFEELEQQYYIFNNLPKLQVTFVSKNSSKKELFFILKSIRIPIKITG